MSLVLLLLPISIESVFRKLEEMYFVCYTSLQSQRHSTMKFITALNKESILEIRGTCRFLQFFCTNQTK